MAKISVTDLKKYYGKVKAVDGVSFRVEAGEIFGLLGPNGAGKTTTIETMVGLIPRDFGTIRINGIDPRDDAATLKLQIGVQLQTAAVFPRLKMKELLELFAGFYRNHFKPNEILKLIGLEEKAGTQTAKLSGGQLQRLSVGLALIGNGSTLFLDEPTTGLDPQARRCLWGIVEEMKSRGKTILLTTHYMDEAEKLCDRVAIIDQGKIIALDSPKQLIKESFSDMAIEFSLPESPGTQSVIEKLTDLTSVKRIQYEDGTVFLYSAEVSQTITALMHYAKETTMPVENLIIRSATLEDVFIKLTGRRLSE